MQLDLYPAQFHHTTTDLNTVRFEEDFFPKGVQSYQNLYRKLC